MYVVYRILIKSEQKYERIKELNTLEEANEFLLEHRDDEDLYTIMME